MDPETTMAVLLGLWPRLPTLAGRRWPELYWQLVDLLRAFRAARDADTRAEVAIQVQRLLAGVPEIRAAWTTELTERQRMPERGTRGAPLSLAPTRREEVADALDTVIEPPSVTRHTDLLLPGRVQAAQRFPVVVGLKCQRIGTGDGSQPIEARPGRTVRVAVAATDLDVLGDRVKELLVEADRDSDPVVFYLRAAKPGDYSLVLDFWVDGQVAASAAHSVQALAEPTSDSGTQRPPLPLRVGTTRVPHPDLILRVTTEENGLRFDLHFGDTHFVHIEGDRLRTDPQAFRYRLLQEIEGLARGAGKPQRFLVRELEKIGQRLYRQLFPPELRREYRRFRRDVKTLHIVSDEPWIPWELIKPYDDDDPAALIDDDFLCLQFELARWVSSAARGPSSEIAVDAAAFIVPSDSGLPEAQAELEHLRAWAEGCQVQTQEPAPADVAAVERLLGSDLSLQLWHFACHGNFDAGSPGQAPLFLENGDRLRPDDLVGPAQTHLKRDRPLIFLNACRVGTGGLSLTGLGGWANVLVEECGVGALVAPMWSVGDSGACRFARTFYESLRDRPGCTIGQAVRQARCKVRENWPDDPTWLAYSLYSHPNARVRSGKG